MYIVVQLLLRNMYIQWKKMGSGFQIIIKYQSKVAKAWALSRKRMAFREIDRFKIFMLIILYFGTIS